MIVYPCTVKKVCNHCLLKPPVLVSWPTVPGYPLVNNSKMYLSLASALYIIHHM